MVRRTQAFIPHLDHSPLLNRDKESLAHAAAVHTTQDHAHCWTGPHQLPTQSLFTLSCSSRGHTTRSLLGEKDIGSHTFPKLSSQSVLAALSSIHSTEPLTGSNFLCKARNCNHEPSPCLMPELMPVKAKA